MSIRIGDHSTRRRGLSLLELVMSLLVVSVLLGGLASAVVVAGRVIEVDSAPAAVSATGRETLAEMCRDFQIATAITDHDATAATLTVPDRTGDGQPETIRYAWSGTPGDPITRVTNDAAQQTLVTGVSKLNLDYLTRTMQGTWVEVEPPLAVAMVVEDVGSIGAGEDARKAIIESFGFSVSYIGEEADQNEYDAAATAHDVFYVPDTIDHDDLDVKLTELPTGVVTEERHVAKLLGLVEKDLRDFDDTTLTVTDDTHYISEPFGTNDVALFTGNVKMLRRDGGLAPGLRILGHRPTKPSEQVLFTLEAGLMRWDNTPSPARRVALPWGTNVDTAKLTGDAKTLLRRSLEWAAEHEEQPLVPEESTEMVLAFHDDAPDGKLKTSAVETGLWPAQFVRPTLPVNLLSWTITKVKMMIKEGASPDNGVFEVQILAADGDELPTASVLESLPMLESDLDNGFIWRDFEFTTVSGLGPSTGICIVFQGVSGSGQSIAQLRREQDGNPMTPATHHTFSTDGGVTWLAANDTEDLFFYLYGTVTTLGPPEWPAP